MSNLFSIYELFYVIKGVIYKSFYDYSFYFLLIIYSTEDYELESFYSILLGIFTYTLCVYLFYNFL